MDTTEQEEVLLPLKTNYQEQNLIYSEKKFEPSKRSLTPFFVCRVVQDEKSGSVFGQRDLTISRDLLNPVSGIRCLGGVSS